MRYFDEQLVANSRPHAEWWADVSINREHFHQVEEHMASLNNAAAVLPRDAWMDVDSITRRAVVSRSAKLWRLVAATASAAAMPHGKNPPPVEAGRPLLMAVVALDLYEPHHAPPRFGERVGGVAEAFMRLQQRETGGGALEPG